jgi:hypothetical protein
MGFSQIEGKMTTIALTDKLNGRLGWFNLRPIVRPSLADNYRLPIKCNNL